jgi:hypothetical protein
VAETVAEVRSLLAWVADRGDITPTAARRSVGLLAGPSVDLPAAERLRRLFYEMARKHVDAQPGGPVPTFDEIVEDFLVLGRVAPGRLWLLDGVGPLKVPEAASALARPAWTVNLVLGRSGDTGEVLEAGNVYPETLA